MKELIILFVLVLLFVGIMIFEDRQGESMGNECYHVPYGEACVIRIDGTPYLFYSKGGVVRHEPLVR